VFWLARVSYRLRSDWNIFSGLTNELAYRRKAQIYVRKSFTTVGTEQMLDYVSLIEVSIKCSYFRNGILKNKGPFTRAISERVYDAYLYFSEIARARKKHISL
jgi:hypothetical protein